MTADEKELREEVSAQEEMARMLMRAGWSEKEAREEAIRALDDAAQEDGYDGP